MLAVYLVVTCILAFIINYIIKIKIFQRKLKGLKGPKPLPFLGNALDFSTPTKIIKTILKYHTEYGSVVVVRIGLSKTMLLVTDCDFLEFVMTSNKLIDKANNYDNFKAWLGNGLFTAPAKPWKKQRKMITPAFHFKVLELMVQQFPKSNKILIDKLNKLYDSGTRDIDAFPIITLCALDTIYETAMGVHINCQEEENNPYVKAIEKFLKIALRRQTSALKQSDLMFRLSSDYCKQQEAIKVLHKTTDDLIKKKRQELSTHKKNDTNSNDMGIKSKKAFLDLLLEYEIDGKPLTDDEIRQEVDTIMFGGHDTTSSAISFALYSLSRNPEVQAKVLEEIHDILGKNNDNPTYNDLQEMKYLEMVIKETLRLYPSAYMFGRSVNEDMEFKGHFLPKGLTIMCSAYAMQRDPKIYPNPDKFDPERFTPENQKTRNPYNYIPFSAGYRNCIGQKFAMFSMKATISAVVSNFELLPSKIDAVLMAEIILKSETGAHVVLKRRA